MTVSSGSMGMYTVLLSWLCITDLLRRGGYVQGGGADNRYNLSFIVKNSAEAGIPIIGVSINYRLAG